MSEARIESLDDEVFVCANCGDICTSLNEITGWCDECSPAPCERCGGPRTSNNKYCSRCQRIQWVERNADRLEDLISQGLTFTQAKQKILNENRAICVVCESEIPGKHKSNTLFCEKNIQCKRAKWRYENSVRHGTPREEALINALREVAP